MGRRLLFFINSLLAVITLLLVGLSNVPPSQIPVFPFVTLGMPICIVLNLFFVLFWGVRLMKNILLSLITLVFVYYLTSSFISFSTHSKEVLKKHDLRLMSYNAHYFLKTENRKEFDTDFLSYLKKGNKPQVLFLQETSFNTKVKQEFKYITKNFIQQGTTINYILSDFQIVNSGMVGVNDLNKGRNSVFADLVIHKDTIRTYNIHLTSYKFNKDPEKLQKGGIDPILNRLKVVFKYQEEQVKVIVKHIKESPYPVIIAGDFNNTAFSYVYKQLLNSKNLKDTFVEQGSGLGATLDFKYFPTRIDFILVPKLAEVLSHKVHKIKDWSDHYPVETIIRL